MLMMKCFEIRKVILFLFAVTTLLAAKTGQKDFRVELLSFEEGVSHNLVYSIIQDKYGFMWFGTMYGLIRYDGVDYLKFKHDPDDTNSISNDDIVSIFEADNGDLWLGTYNGGLNRYIRSQNKFKRFGKDFFGLGDRWDGTIWAMAEDAEGNLWLATRGAGVIKFKYANNDFEVYEFTGRSDNYRRNNSIFGICYDRSNECIWLVSGGGLLHRYEKSSNIFISINPFEQSEKPGFDYLTSVMPYTDSSLIVGSNKGPVLFDIPSNLFTKILFDNDSILSGSSIQTLMLDDSNRLWSGTNRGLFVTDMKSMVTNRIKEGYDFSSENFIKNAITICEDRTGVVWAGSYLSGIYKIRSDNFLFKKVFTDKQVNALEYINGNILAGFNDGIKLYGIDKMNSSSSEFLQQKLADKTITSVEKDSFGNYWFGSNDGLYLYQYSSKSIQLFQSNENKVNSLSSNSINCIAAASKNSVWIGTAYGLNEYSYSTKQLRRFTPVNTSMEGTNVLSVFEDSNGDIWFGTFLGLNRYIPTTDTIIVYQQDSYNSQSLSNNYVYDMLEDLSGNLWLATAGGLNLFNRTTETFSHFDKKDGLASPVLFGLQLDSTGHIWISSNRGLIKFDPVSKTFVNYDTRDGLQSNMFNGSSLKRPDGRMVFGGIKGFNIVDPSVVLSDTTEANIVLTSLKIFDKEMNEEADINKLSSINLDYDENFIQFRFASTDYRNPQKNFYRYMLAGVDKSWIYNGNSNMASYTNLNPGEYVFTIQSAGRNGVWSDKVKKMGIVITPPFWETSWFSILMLAASLLVVYILYRRKVIGEIKKRIELEKIRVRENEKVRRKAADDFHDELGHHITKISLFSEILKRNLESVGEETTGYIDKIIELTKSLSTGVRDFIWTLDPEKDSLYEVAVRLKDFGDDLFDKTGIAFSVEGISEDFQQVKLSVDWRRHLTLLFKEAMNNSLKYARCSNVTLSFDLIDRNLKMSLRDNGSGIGDNLKSSGRGIKNFNRRVSNLNGKLDILSDQTIGTEIRFEGELA